MGGWEHLGGGLGGAPSEGGQGLLPVAAVFIMSSESWKEWARCSSQEGGER